jgi:hypothetical protein
MEKLPRINFWKERVTGDGQHGNIPPGTDFVIACHACRNWDVPSNGVFLLFTWEELYGREYSKRVDWRARLEEALKARERRLVRDYSRRVRHHLADYYDDEIWVPA